MPQPSGEWVLIFSDGTGQRGVRDDGEAKTEGDFIVKNTNVFQMFSAAEPNFKTFYDAGLGAPDEGDMTWSRTARNIWSKATGWGISANIADCYEALMIEWKPGMKIGFFGFSRGAYTVRCLGGVLSACGIATTDGSTPISSEEKGSLADRRRKIAEEAVAVYKIGKKEKRKAAGAAFAARYSAAQVMPTVIGVFDTVASVGLPGVMDMVNPWKHEFHDTVLSSRVPVGLQALSIDENRKAFLPVLWSASETGPVEGQVIEQVWFPGVHSDIGGGYDDDNSLANASLLWLLDRLRTHVGLDIPMTINREKIMLGPAHDERTGWGKFYLPVERSIQGESDDVDALCVGIEERFDKYQPSYRPRPLEKHPRVMKIMKKLSPSV